MPKWIDKDLSTISFEVRGRIAYITFNRPEKRNAQNMTALTELNHALLEADDRKDVRVIVLAGNGKDFCAGADLGTGLASGDARPFDPEDYRGRSSYDDDAWGIERSSELRLIFHTIHKPVIAKIHGNCLAVGTDIALACDMLIAADDARIGFPATRAIGCPANHMWLYHVGPQWAKRMLMTGDSLLGKDAERIGLVLKSVPRERLDEEVDKLANRVALIDAEMLTAHKRIVNIGLDLMGRDTLQRFAAENNARAHLSPAYSHFLTAVKEQGIKAALNERDGPFGDPVITFD
jgi:enoyl-CoA hydratase